MLIKIIMISRKIAFYLFGLGMVAIILTVIQPMDPRVDKMFQISGVILDIVCLVVIIGMGILEKHLRNQMPLQEDETEGRDNEQFEKKQSEIYKDNSVTNTESSDVQGLGEQSRSAIPQLTDQEIFDIGECPECGAELIKEQERCPECGRLLIEFMDN